MPKQNAKSRRKREFLFDAPTNALQWHECLKPFDVLAEQLDEKWGPERLQECQAQVVKDRWLEVLDDLNKATRGQDEDALREAVGVAIHGLQVMDAKAEAAGFKPAEGHAMLTRLTASPEDFFFGVTTTDAEARAAKARNPDAVIWTIEQVASLALASMKAAPIGEVIQAFPKARIKSIETLPPDFFKNGGDEIPF